MSWGQSRTRLASKKKRTRPNRCASCGKGELRHFARAGRTFAYKGFNYPIKPTLKLVECDHCHELPMTPAEVEAIEGPIAERHQRRMAALVDGALSVLEKKSLTIGRIEQALHLSQGYLARARTKGEPSFPLAALLTLLAENPQKLETLEELVPVPTPQRT